MPKEITKDEFLDMLRREVKRAGTQKALAAQIGINETVLSRVLSGREDPGPTILDHFGFEKIKTFTFRKKPS